MKRGRPPLPKGRVKDQYVPFRITDADFAAMTEATKKSRHKTLSAWIRHTLRKAVECG